MESKKTVLRTLITSNGFLVNNVFVFSHLPVDESKKITNENGTFAPVVSDRIKTYSQLESLVLSTYTEDVAFKLLNEPKKYTEIDGTLYFDMQYSSETEPNYVWTVHEIESEGIADEKYLFTVTVENSKGRNKKIEVEAIDVDGYLKLCAFYS